MNYEADYWDQKLRFALSEHEATMQQLKNQSEPSMFLKPRIFIDGNMWCALYGENIQDGVCGFGETPGEAFFDFNKNWKNQKAKV